jgi:superfamily II DNA/RNA helicase/cold shock CspA family protein
LTTFAELGVRPRTLAALARHHITEPLPVQAVALPELLRGRDAVIQAPTGSGKTLAFGIPLAERLGTHARGGPRALIVVPTRELAAQIADVLRTIDPQLRLALLIGGVGYGGQLAALRHDPDVVIGCPGRILDLVERRAVRFDAVGYLVLDEGDEMLDQGFAHDVERIIAFTPAGKANSGRQTVLASATMPDWVKRMVDKHLIDPAQIRVAAGEQEPALEHGLVKVRREERVNILSRVLDAHKGSAIVFHRTKHGAKKLVRDLALHGHRSSELQGNLSQNARDRAIDDFRKLRTTVLVATNVAARGLDVSHVQLVVNYELPESAQWLTHRVGRTARNGAEGRALTFLSDDDLEQWRKLRRGGAPDLPWIDLEVLLDTGSMETTAAAGPASAAFPRPAGLVPLQRAHRERIRRGVPPFSTGLRRTAVHRREAGDLHMQNGTIKKLVSDRGFGFIASEDGKEYFFHRSGTVEEFDGLRAGEKVTFEVEASPKGPRAAKVKLAD